ncbi:MAG TPA: hypothetical protein ENN06_03270 [Desulfobacteraceae bacterium]|nr:hypothetical protein [Desulfobacteraceae bacterium]
MFDKRWALFIPLIMILLVGSTAPCASTPPRDAAGLRQSVLALDSAWNRARNDLEQKKQAGVLGEAERSDYARFIAFLSDRIQQYCRDLITLGGSSAVLDLPCPDGGSPGMGPPAAAAPTTAEQIARLDDSFAQALGEFDEMLLKEEQRIASRSPRQRETGGDDGSGRYGGGSAAGGGAGTAPGPEGEETGDGAGAQQGSLDPGGTADRDAGGTTPAGREQSGASRTGQDGGASGGGEGPGNDRTVKSGDWGGSMPPIQSGYDDIVARQLREAAEKETDPELKEKLWEEYRRYTEGIR